MNKKVAEGCIAKEESESRSSSSSSSSESDDETVRDEAAVQEPLAKRPRGDGSLVKKSVKRKIRYHVGRLPAAVVSLEIPGIVVSLEIPVFPIFLVKISRKIVKIGFLIPGTQIKF